MPAVLDPMISAPARLAAVRRTGLLDTGAEEPFDRLTRLACQLLDAPYGFVTVVDERRSFWKSCIGVASQDPAERQNAVEESFCQYVVAANDKLIVGDARLNPLTSENPSIELMGVIAWAGFPVRSPDGHVLGTFCVADTRPRTWSAQDEDVLEVLAHAAGGEVGLRISLDEANVVARRATALARTLQDSLLPPALPDIPGLDVATVYLPGRGGDEVLGDFYDVVATTQDGYGIFVGDVSGQGAPAARSAALARYTLRASAMQHFSPVIVLHELHRALSGWFDTTDDVGYLTIAYAALRRDGDGFAVRITTAGHPPAILRRADGGLHAIGLAGTALGCLPKVTLTAQDEVLRPGDTLILYSDGVTGAYRRDRAAILDVPGLLEMLAEVDAGSAGALADGLAERVLAYSVEPVRDDIVIMALQIPRV